MGELLMALLEPLGELLMELFCYVVVKAGQAVWQAILGLFQ